MRLRSCPLSDEDADLRDGRLRSTLGGLRICPDNLLAEGGYDVLMSSARGLGARGAAAGLGLPPALQHLRHLLEARMGNRGKREFIQVLRLLEIAAKEVVAAAVADAIHVGAIGFDAVRQIVLARIERRPAKLDLTAYPYLPGTDVRMTRATDYAALVQERAA